MESPRASASLSAYGLGPKTQRKDDGTRPRPLKFVRAHGDLVSISCMLRRSSGGYTGSEGLQTHTIQNGGEFMPYANLVRNSATLYLTAVDWLTTPLRVLAQSPAAPGEERQAHQQEVWDEWANQPTPHQGLIFE